MTCINIETGTEGPTHDPYGWEEMTVIRSNGDEVMLHSGLSLYVDVNGQRFDSSGLDESASWDQAAAKFEEHAGCTPAVARNAYWRYKNTCRKCGSCEQYGQTGFPGETLWMCCNCDAVVSCDFDIGAVV